MAQLRRMIDGLLMIDDVRTAGQLLFLVLTGSFLFVVGAVCVGAGVGLGVHAFKVLVN